MRTMEDWLKDRISQGKDYQRQDLEDETEAEGDFDEEESKSNLKHEIKETLAPKDSPIGKKTSLTSLGLQSPSKLLMRRSKIFK